MRCLRSVVQNRSKAVNHPRPDILFAEEGLHRVDEVHTCFLKYEKQLKPTVYALFKFIR